MSDPAYPTDTPSEQSSPPQRPSRSFFPLSASSPVRSSFPSSPLQVPSSDDEPLVMENHLAPPSLGPILASPASTSAENVSTTPADTPSTRPNAIVGVTPWHHHRVPAFFIAGADGRLHPHFGPPSMPFIWPFHGFRERLPNPAKAAELLRSLTSVEKGLMQRIDKIVAAEDASDGWSCSICYEAADLDKEAVKALPCNHLFHEGCLTPWFASKVTCPTCRLDLDPLRTLDPLRASQLRPTAIMMPRPRISPYARPEGIVSNSSPDPAPARDSAGTPASGNAATAANPPPISGPPPTIFWRMPTPYNPPPGEGVAVEQPAADSLLPERPRTPTRVFNIPLHASPLPMEASGSAPSLALPPPLTGQPLPWSIPQHHPETVHFHRSPAAPFGYSALQQFPQLGPLLRPSSSEEDPPQSRRSLRTYEVHVPQPADAAEEPPRPRISPVLIVPSELADMFSTPSANVIDRLQQTPSAHPNLLPQASTASSVTPDTTSGTSGAGNGNPASLLDPPTSVPLEAWTQRREKSLGWRCDGQSCLIAPPVESRSDQDMCSEFSPEDKEMLNVFSGLPSESTDQAIACPHRWHRACLDAAERTSGRWMPTSDDSGRRLIRCGVCETDGWVLSGESTGSEGEVEDMCYEDEQARPESLM